MPDSDDAADAVDDEVRAVVGAQLGRPPRALRRVAHRCSCGLPDVIETNPVLPDGSPFPTLYYLTCPRAASAIGTLESNGVMRDMNARLAADRAIDGELAQRYAAADAAYRERRTALGGRVDLPTAGGMPVRVKCLHALVAHALAAGPGVNPFGDEALALVDDWGRRGPCVPTDADPAGEGA